MSTCFKCKVRYLSLFLIFSVVYMIVEWIYKGDISRLHWSMGVLAGYSAIIAGNLNNRFTYKMDLLFQMLISAAFITVGEGIVGMFFNQSFLIWDYRSLPFTFWHGQCNLLFSFAWFLCSSVLIVTDDIIYYYILKDNDVPPYYVIFNKVVFSMKERKHI